MYNLTARRPRTMCTAILLAVMVSLAGGYALGAGGDAVEPQAAAPHGDPRRGAALISQFGCGTCHVVPGIGSATGNVGPPLTRMGGRAYIAGVLANTADNMERWLRKPQEVVPGNAMPDLGLSERDARDLTAYLDTLR